MMEKWWEDHYCRKISHLFSKLHLKSFTQCTIFCSLYYITLTATTKQPEEFNLDPIPLETQGEMLKSQLLAFLADTISKRIEFFL